MPAPLTEKLILRQINHWNRIREFLPDLQPENTNPPGPIITISRQAGSGGRALAEALADRLELQLHDQSLVEKIAHDHQLEKELIAQLDETETHQARLWVRGVLDQKIFLRNQYHMALVKVVTGLAAKGNAIFLGRGANLILGTNASLRLRLVASHRVRLRRLLDRTHLSRPEARVVLEETDRQRHHYIRKVFRVEPGLPENYDLIINTERLGLEAQVELVLLTLLGAQSAAPVEKTAKS